MRNVSIIRRIAPVFIIGTIAATSVVAPTVQASPVDEVVATIDTGGGMPWGVAVTPNGLKAFVTNFGSDTVSEIDTSTNRVVDEPISVGLEANPVAIAITPNGQFAYVANNGNNTVSVINTTSREVVPVMEAVVPVGEFDSSSVIAVIDTPSGIAITPDGTKAYVTNFDDDTVTVIDTATKTVVETIALAPVISDLDSLEVLTTGGPTGIAITPNGLRVFVTNYESDSVKVINTADNTVVGDPISVGIEPRAVVVAPNGLLAYVVNRGDNSVTVINTVVTPPVVVETIDLPELSSPSSLAIAPLGDYLYVTNSGSNTVSVIDTETRVVTGAVPVGIEPSGIATSPDGSYVYTANQLSGNVSVIGRRAIPVPDPVPDVSPPSEQPIVTSSTSTPVPASSVVPVVVPVPTELKPGVGSLMIDGVVTPVTVVPSPDGKELVVSGGGVRLVLNAVGPDGKALPLARDGSLVLSQAGGLPMAGSGFAAGSTVTLFMFSTPVTLGTATANATGGYATDVVIPAATATGSHTIQVIGTTASGQPIVLSIGVTVKTAIAARGSNPTLIVTRTHNAGSRFVVEARGVQARCNVKFWVKGSTVNTQSGAAGKARATLKAPRTKGNWVVTATTQGTGCDRVTTSTRVSTK